MKRIHFEDVEKLIRLALDEDLGGGDITSRAIFSQESRSLARIFSKEDGIFCGADMIGYVYGMISEKVSVDSVLRDGINIVYGDEVACLSGPTIALLEGERIVLNFLQHMSGIATRTGAMVKLLEGTGIKLLDTRKTVPGFRFLDKYAVAVGGGVNHRMGLYDMIMIKDNHIEAAGGIPRAIELVRKKHNGKYRVEVEASTVEEAGLAADCGADIIMLDNMTCDMMQEAVSIIAGRAGIEVSGNMDEDKIRSLKKLDIDFVSAGVLTHSVRAFDLSMKFTRVK